MFDFLKQDTTFTRLDFRVDLDFKVGRASRISIFTNITTSNLLSTSQFENATTLPEFADIDHTLYGLSIELNELDDPLLPKSGTTFYLSGGLGNKTINPIAELPPDYSPQYGPGGFTLELEAELLAKWHAEQVAAAS